VGRLIGTPSIPAALGAALMHWPSFWRDEAWQALIAFHLCVDILRVNPPTTQERLISCGKRRPNQLARALCRSKAAWCFSRVRCNDQPGPPHEPRSGHAQ